MLWTDFPPAPSASETTEAASSIAFLRLGISDSKPPTQFRAACAPHSLSPFPLLRNGPALGTVCPRMSFTAFAILDAAFTAAW